MNIDALKRRRNIMIAATGGCAAGAFIAFAAGLLLNKPYLLVAGLVFVTAGCAAQVWFILAFAREGRAK